MVTVLDAITRLSHRIIRILQKPAPAATRALLQKTYGGMIVTTLTSIVGMPLAAIAAPGRVPADMVGTVMIGQAAICLTLVLSHAWISRSD